MIRRTVLALLLTFTALTLFMFSMVDADPTAPPTRLDAAAARYSRPGPHPVGVTQLRTTGSDPVELWAWYPAAPADQPTATSYPYTIQIAQALGSTAVGSWEGRAASDGTPDRNGGPRPLVVLSPGYGMGPTAYAWLAEHLASHGFVVTAAEHDETLASALDGGLWRASVSRPRHVRSVLAAVEGQAGADGVLDGVVDTEAVAVVGHSVGGYAALVAGGARLSTGDLQRACAAGGSPDAPPDYVCDALVPHLADMAELAGLDTVPAGLWSDWSSARVDAVVSLAGDAYLLGRDGLATLSVPVLAIGGTEDGDTPYRWGAQPTFARASSTRRVAVALRGADHFVFTNRCERVRRILTLVPEGFCDDAAMGRQLAHDVTGHLVTAFLRSELVDDGAAAAALDPAAVDLPDTAYTAIGY